MQMQFLNWRFSVERVFHPATQLSAMYDHSAEGWDDSLKRLGYDLAYDKLMTHLNEMGVLSRLPHNAQVLDCGIGTGALSHAFAQQHAGQTHITGVDISGGMLAQAHQKLSSAGVDTTLQIGNVLDLPFEDASFDVVMTAHVVEHLEDPFAGLSELLRVLKPGRPFIFVISRKGLVSPFLSLRWNYRALTSNMVLNWLDDATCVDVSHHSLTSRAWISDMSAVYIGYKSR